MGDMRKLGFPPGSLLAAMLGEHAPTDVRRAAQRLRAEGAPALAVDDDIAALAAGLASSAVSRSAAVLDALPPLFWLEARRGEGAEHPGISGWVVERKRGEVALRQFGMGVGPGTAPEREGTATLRFGAGAEEGEADYVRGLITAVSLPEMLSQMGESAPVVLMPAEASSEEASLLRGFRLSVAVSRDSVPA